ncbi:FAD dependent oxidoreductase [Fomitopsis serialis]|uniref:FAD dependent oxidoreductase n=1 Tax=Fomitopsis serialis TaxID=139415 RepID=UPI002007F27A|nr:FAD dependent oxidoreductase [Neoantrodia serialis]KAH9923353.1 FAD dependent oxidoreductase [Neoantrodia serialis]
MGNLASKVKLYLAATAQLKETFDLLNKRIETPPGIPVPNPTRPFWTVPASAISTHDEPFPYNADIVIVGSGITGTSVAYNILSNGSKARIVMLEARDVCSGATARNGGHINPPLYHDYSELEESFGEDAAKRMIRFRLAHQKEMQRIAEKECIVKESQVRETEHLDVYTCPETYTEAKENLRKWKSAMPDESKTFGFMDAKEAVEKYHLSPDTLGCIYGSGGAMHPYRFVTSLLAKLLDKHSDNFHVATHTPCLAIIAPSADSPHYVIETSRGPITALHIVHATNGWCSHLLEPLRTKVIPARGVMSAQRPGTLLRNSTLDGYRSFVFYRGTSGYDYLTQLPTGEHELMYGGGWAQSCENSLPDIGITDDSVFNFAGAAHLAGSLPLYFGGDNWGGEAVPAEEPEGEVRWGIGRTKAQWSGILGISTDLLPWVGRLPAKVSGRPEPRASSADRFVPVSEKEGSCLHLASPGEWLAAGYTGEGMVHAWMSGRALAYMILDQEDALEDWFPDILRVTEKRWKKASVDTLVARFM